MRLFKTDRTFEDKVRLVVTTLLRAAILLGLGWALGRGEWEAFFISVVALLLSFTPDLIRSTTKIRFPLEFDLTIVLFIFAAVFLGEIGDAYERFWWWDAMLHTASGVILSFGGFLILYIMYYQGRLKASPLAIAFFTFCVGMALGGLWEIFEFTVDQNFGTNMQKNGLHDSMWDLIVDGAGALGVAIAARYQMAADPHDGWITGLARRFIHANPAIRRRWWKRA